MPTIAAKTINKAKGSKAIIYKRTKVTTAKTSKDRRKRV